MRIKLSVKEALSQIDSLLKEGVKIMDLIRGANWSAYKHPVITSHQDYLDFEEKESEPDNLEYLECIEIKLQTWVEKCLKKLHDIYLDETPIYKFRNAKAEVDRDRRYNKVYIELEASLEGKLNVLAEYYDELRSFIACPLVYDPEKAQIRFYDFVCHLTPDTNEATLCKYLFEFGIGELKDFADIYAYITGKSLEEQDRWPKDWKATIISAYDGINGKTNKKIGFNVLSKAKNQLCVNFPNRFIKSKG